MRGGSEKTGDRQSDPHSPSPTLSFCLSPLPAFSWPLPKADKRKSSHAQPIYHILYNLEGREEEGKGRKGPAFRQQDQTAAGQLRQTAAAGSRQQQQQHEIKTKQSSSIMAIQSPWVWSPGVSESRTLLLLFRIFENCRAFTPYPFHHTLPSIHPPSMAGRRPPDYSDDIEK